MNAGLQKERLEFPKDLKFNPIKEMPERVLQFGEGNFLRGFVDWMIDIMNEESLFNGRVS